MSTPTEDALKLAERLKANPNTARDIEAADAIRSLVAERDAARATASRLNRRVGTLEASLAELGRERDRLADALFTAELRLSSWRGGRDPKRALAPNHPNSAVEEKP